MTDTPIDYERLARVYLKIRDARASLTREYDKKYDELTEQLNVIQDTLVAGMTKSKQKTVGTDAGRISKQLDITPTATNWDALYAWIKKHDAFEALEKRVKKTFVSEYMEENNGKVPPGVSVMKKYVVRITRPSS